MLKRIKATSAIERKISNFAKEGGSEGRRMCPDAASHPTQQALKPRIYNEVSRKLSKTKAERGSVTGTGCNVIFAVCCASRGMETTSLLITHG